MFHMQLAVSTGSCFPFLKSRLKQIEAVAAFYPKARGIELIFARPCDLMRFNPSKKTVQVLKRFDFVNLHYPFGKHARLSAIPEKKVLKKTRQLDSMLGLRHVVVHPAAIGELKAFQEASLPFLVENQEAGEGKQWQTPRAMKKLGRETGFKMCFDINHALSCGIMPVEFLSLKREIMEVHVNATEAFGKEAEHNFLAASSQKTLKMIAPALGQLRRAVWVIEAKSHKSPGLALKREILLLERLWHRR
jgi:hypothetical protein